MFRGFHFKIRATISERDPNLCFSAAVEFMHDMAGPSGLIPLSQLLEKLSRIPLVPYLGALSLSGHVFVTAAQGEFEREISMKMNLNDIISLNTCFA